MALPHTFTKESTEKGPSRYVMSCLKKSGEKVKIRVLTDFMEGKSVWGERDGKPYPYRFKPGESVPVKCIGVNSFTNKPNTIKRFIVAVAWNYATKQVEIFECDKQDVNNTLFDLEHDADWGDTKGYDITIARSGEKQDTRYSVIPSNKNAFTCPKNYLSVDVTQLFTGGNPFADEQGTTTDMSDEDIEDITDKIPF